MAENSDSTPVLEMLAWTYQFVDPYEDIAWDIRRHLEENGIAAHNEYLRDDDPENYPNG
jgi:hypothetical protein